MSAGSPASPLDTAMDSAGELEPGFDGNRTDLVTQWYFRVGAVDPVDCPDLLRRLLDFGLDWVVVPAFLDND